MGIETPSREFAWGIRTSVDGCERKGFARTRVRKVVILKRKFLAFLRRFAFVELKTGAGDRARGWHGARSSVATGRDIPNDSPKKFYL